MSYLSVLPKYDAEENRRLILLEPTRGLRVLKSFGQPHVTPASEPAVNAIAEAMDVEKRQRAEVAIGRGELPAGDERATVGDEVAVGQYGALRRAGRARRMREHLRDRRPCVEEARRGRPQAPRLLR